MTGEACLCSDLALGDFSKKRARRRNPAARFGYWSIPGVTPRRLIPLFRASPPRRLCMTENLGYRFGDQSPKWYVGRELRFSTVILGLLFSRRPPRARPLHVVETFVRSVQGRELGPDLASFLAVTSQESCEALPSSRTTPVDASAQAPCLTSHMSQTVLSGTPRSGDRGVSVFL